jgi:two-component system sensor histidine kinase KdpD
VSESERPTPEQFLAQASEEDANGQRGRLKLFLGAAPGVGKTYAMLEAAQVRRRRGDDVVVGWLETHGRAETEALAKGIERVPPRTVEHRGLTLREMDLDAVVERRPALALVDELAHTNAPGSRHARRWQDVEEILEAGIDVLTTLNVQHVESLHDVVAQITGVTVRETVPDRILERADEIELVDLPPEELLRRLEEGKVYVPEQAQRAMQSFFRKGNLIALRELALRRTADRVDVQAEEWKRRHGAARPWGARERVLVAVGPAPKSADVVRAAARMAKGLHAPWIALSIETSAFNLLSDEDRARVEAHLVLAESLGAERLVVRGERVGDEILAVARKRDVTRIVVGKPAPRGLVARLRPTLVDWLVRGSGSIDVHVTSGAPGPSPLAAMPRPPAVVVPWGPLWAVGIVALATAVCWVARSWMSPADLAMVYLLGVLGAAAKLARRDSMLAAVLSVVALDFFFVPPFHTLVVDDPGYVTTFVVLLVTGLVVSHFASRVRRQARTAQEREQRALGLYALSRALSATADADEIAVAATRAIQDELRVDAVVYRTSGRGIVAISGKDSPLATADRERAVAQWVADNGRPAGRTTQTLPASVGLYLPAVGRSGLQAVVGVALGDRPRPLSPADRQTLDAYVGLMAGALERAALVADAERARVVVETERTRSTLLAAVSHDLRTPLASIMGAAGGLLEKGAPIPEATRERLLEGIRDEAQRLGRLVADLLDLTRIEAGGFVLQKEWYPLEEVVASALDHLKTRLVGRKIDVNLPPEPLLVETDGVLLEQVVINLLENAAKHTPSGTPVEIRVSSEPKELVVEVLDRGPGIPAGEEQRIFERFHRLPTAHGVEGAGLGLALCRAIVRAHGGHIEAENRPGGGAVFRFGLPREKPPELPPENGFEAPSTP